MKNNNFFQKIDALNAEIEKFDSLAIAFSGGVDSTFLLAVAQKKLGDKVFAIIVKTPLLPEYEAFQAIKFLKTENIKYSIISPDLILLDNFTKNTKDRCYICKNIIFKAIINEAAKKRIKNIAHGVNTDDFNDYRPGLKAADELGVFSPLAIAGFSKEDIRAGSRYMKLCTAEKPAMACLASRIPYGSVITKKKLKTIEKAETILRNLGFDFYRVRHHGKIAKIEVSVEKFELIMKENIRQTIVREFKLLGFLYITTDLEGYTQGSLNKTL